MLQKLLCWLLGHKWIVSKVKCSDMEMLDNTAVCQRCLVYRDIYIEDKDLGKCCDKDKKNG